jgi:hypothetical protein
MSSAITDNGNGTFTDRSSGLMWQKDDDGNTRTKGEAVAYCSGLKLAGFTDWRLPTLAEIQALSRTAKSNELGLIAHFSLSASDVYWTETLGPQSNVSYVADGTTMFNTNKYPVRAVRKT